MDGVIFFFLGNGSSELDMYLVCWMLADFRFIFHFKIHTYV